MTAAAPWESSTAHDRGARPHSVLAASRTQRILNDVFRHLAIDAGMAKQSSEIKRRGQHVEEEFEVQSRCNVASQPGSSQGFSHRFPPYIKDATPNE